MLHLFIVSRMKEVGCVAPALGYEARPTGFECFTKGRRVSH